MPKETTSKKSVKNANGDVSMENLLIDKESLEKQVKELQQNIRRLKLEKDILEEAAKVIKKARALIFHRLKIAKRP